MSYIELNKLTKVYDDADKRVVALDSVDLSISQGSYLSIVGASGAGKSTLLHMISGLDEASEGSVTVDHMDMGRLRGRELFAFRNKKMGFVFQFYHLIHELTAVENVMLPAVAAGRKFKDCFSRAKELLSFFGLEQRERFYPQELSGGEQQRIALARALMNQPDILLCDEPTGNLDAEATNLIRKHLLYLNKEKNMTIVLVTHNLELANDADSVLNITKGKLC